MGHFAGIGDTEVYEQGIWLEPGGAYDVEVIDMLVYLSRKKDLLFILEMKILSSSSDKHGVGSKATWMAKLGTDSTFPNIKKMFIGMLNINMRDPDVKKEFNDGIEAILEESTEERKDENGKPRYEKDEAGEFVLDDKEEKILETNPLMGEKIHVDTHTTTMDKGGDFTVHTWSPYEEKEQEDNIPY